MSETKPHAAAAAVPDRVIFKTELTRRWGRTRETLWRWEKDGKLPPPDVCVAGRKGWREATILAHEAIAEPQ